MLPNYPLAHSLVHLIPPQEAAAKGASMLCLPENFSFVGSHFTQVRVKNRAERGVWDLSSAPLLPWWSILGTADGVTGMLAAQSESHGKSGTA